MKYIYFYDTIIGKIGIKVNEEYLLAINFNHIYEETDFLEKETDLIKEVYNQLNNYFKGRCKVFNLPISQEGTEFQHSVWNKLQKIPFGEVWSYKKLAISLGKEKAYRAVGMANNKNNIPIIIPCHRVIGSDGTLVGYSGGLKIKQFLIDLERTNNANYK